jgi:hypothetical protein
MDEKEPAKVEPKGPAVGAKPEQQAVSNPITRKLNKILESRIENDKVCFSDLFITKILAN